MKVTGKLTSNDFSNDLNKVLVKAKPRKIKEIAISLDLILDLAC